MKSKHLQQQADTRGKGAALSIFFFRVQLLQALQVEISTFRIGASGVIVALFLVPGLSDHIHYMFVYYGLCHAPKFSWL